MSSASVQLGKHVLKDLDAPTIADHMALQTAWGREVFTESLTHPITSITELKRRQLPTLTLRHPDVVPTTQRIRTILRETVVPHIEKVTEFWSASVDPRIEESVHQILWSPKSIAAGLNTHHWVLTGLLFWKTLLLPGISILMPIVAAIVPFFVLQYLQGANAPTLTDYGTHLKSVLLKQVSMPPMLRAKHNGDFLGKIMEYFFLGLTLATFVSSLWNQILHAKHLRTIAADIRSRGDALCSVREGVEACLTALEEMPTKWRAGVRGLVAEGHRVVAALAAIPREGGLAAYGSVWNHGLTTTLRAWIGRLDVVTTLATTSRICFPVYPRQGVALDVKGVYHPKLAARPTCVRNDASMTEARHILLTGPNRGGKSTFCKSLGVAILTAQTWGFAWADRMTLTPYTAIITALSPADELGRLSLFESEIEFAKTVLDACRHGSGHVFVMMDEIFHSTNARDGVAASQVFLEQLYTFGHVHSLISTHYGELVDLFKHERHLGAWCMGAEERADGFLAYTYRVQPGVSDKSSVMEILHERQLLPADRFPKRDRTPEAEIQP